MRFGTLRGYTRRRRASLAAILIMTAFALLMGRSAIRPRQAFAPSSGTVRTVFDGDTLQLSNGARIRLLGIDAPELGGPEDAVAREARRALTSLTQGRRLALEYGHEARDRYGRWLAYCLLEVDKGEALFVNAELVRLGLARVYPGGASGARRSALFAAEDEARAAGRGLWATGR